MPIYAYKCSTCGFAKDQLQKMSDAPLTVCPACGASTFQKQVTAAGFQLKGSGWYVTDFREGGKSSGEAAGGDKSAKTSEVAPAASAAKAADSSGAPAASSSPAPSPAPAPAPAAAPKKD
ncbi:MAG: FmdB family zinc ribbon protein [Pseudomonadota bacterium]